MCVYDQRAAAADELVNAGCVLGADVSEVAERSDVVFTSLPDPRAVQAVANGDRGLRGRMRPGSAWFDLSTNAPSVIRQLHDEFSPDGVAVLDAPVSGGPAGARSGHLTIWVGGDASVYDRCTPVLDAISDNHRRLGDVGMASIVKLMHNAAGYAINVVMAEVFTAGVAAGADPLQLWSAIRAGNLGRIRIFDPLAEHFLPQSFDPPAFTLQLAHQRRRPAGRTGTSEFRSLPGHLGHPRGDDRGIESRVGTAGFAGGHDAAGRAIRYQCRHDAVEPADLARYSTMAEGDPDPFRLYAFRYATREATRQQHFMAEVDDPDRDMPMDYFVWLATDGRTTCSSTPDSTSRLPPPGGGPGCASRGLSQGGGSRPGRGPPCRTTHLHYDHSGTLEDFPGATFHLQEREYQFAAGRGSDSTRDGFEAADMMRLVDLFYEGRLVLQDGSASPVQGLSMHLVGGHTPGLQVVSVRTERGRVVLMSDASHFYEHYERGLSFPRADDAERTIASFAVIDELADSPEHVVPGHDPRVLARYPGVPNDAGVAGAALHQPPAEQSQCR